MKEVELGCGKATGSRVGEAAKKKTAQTSEAKPKEEAMVTARVGANAPDFQAPAFYKGKFVQIELSKYLKKWVCLCFYPGDFTFV